MSKWIVFIIELNLLLPCFWLSAFNLPTPPAWHHSTAVQSQSMTFYGHSCVNSQRRRIAPSPFPIYVYYLSMTVTVQCFLMMKKKTLFASGFSVTVKAHVH